MPQGVVTHLGLVAGAGLYANTGLTVNAVFVTNVANYRRESGGLIGNLLYSIQEASSNATLSISSPTLASLKAIGADVNGNYCPALGDSIPSNVSLASGNVGFSGQVLGNANVYIGSGNYRVFAQAFQSSLGYMSVTNDVILSVCNSDYLGPTFDDMDNLISGDLSRINLALEDFGQDLEDAGRTLKFDPLDLLGTPAGLLKQISDQGNMVGGTTPAIRAALLDQGLTDQDIKDLVDDNRESLFNPNGLPQIEFDRLQKSVYPALCSITGADLDDALAILGVTTANIEKLCDLLDPKKVFPRSHLSLTLPTPDGPVLIYNDDSTVNSEVEEVLNSGSLVPKGCDDLAKMMPPDQAVANRALQVAFGQVKNIAGLTSVDLAGILA